MTDIKIQIPATFEMIVLITNDETNQSAKATIAINSLSYPTEDDINSRLKEFEESQMTGGLNGFRMMTAEESWDYMCVERAGSTFAMPNKVEWYK